MGADQNGSSSTVTAARPQRAFSRFAYLVDELRQAAVLDLEQIDDECEALEKELQAEHIALSRKFESQYAAVIHRRLAILDENGPAIPGFWKTVLSNSPYFAEDIEKHDEPVLDYIRDIRYEHLVESDWNQGFKICFEFRPNSYFSNPELQKVFHIKKEGTYCERFSCWKIESTVVNWYPGQDVTVETICKKSKGNRRRPQRPKKEEVPRLSFFRTFFRQLGPDQAIPDEEMDDSDADSVDLMEVLMDEDVEQALHLRGAVIPHAIRWYTGEACSDDDESEGDSEQTEENDDAEDDDEDDGEDEIEESRDLEKRVNAGKPSAQDPARRRRRLE